MIRLTCPSCQVRLNAKEELAGKTRKCPKCGGSVLIPEASSVAGAGADEWVGLDEAAPDQHVHDVLDHELPPIESPQRLVRVNRYLICDRTKLVATWEDNGQGWMVRTNTGSVKARKNPDQLPSQGEFVLVELIMSLTDDGLRLRGIRTYEIAKRWALTTLEQDDHRILSRVVGPGRLTKEQKAVVQKFLREQFMRDVWGQSHEVLDYLANFDYHSPGVG